MNPRHTGDMLKHLDKQHELLTEAHKAMTHELQKLQVEEEMMMHKFYELMTAHGLNRKKEGQDTTKGNEIVQATPSATSTGNGEQ